MRKQSIAFLEKLINTPSPSGYEAAIQDVCKEYATSFVDEDKRMV